MEEFCAAVWQAIPAFKRTLPAIINMWKNEDASMNFGADYRIPLLIGVTGHRDLLPADRDGIAERVRAFFTLLKAEFPHTPLRVYSAFAAGADQLVAEVALASGLDVVGVLPMPEAAYVGDFADDPDALARFQRLLEGREVIVLDLEPQTLDDRTLKDRYAVLTNFLAVRCQLLLALWDGCESPEIGGTAFTVVSKLHGRLDADAALIDPIEAGLVYHIPIRRELAPNSQPKPRDGFLATTEIAPYLEALREIDNYNAVPPQSVSNESTVERAFLHADRLALKMQGRVRRSRFAVFGCLSTLVLAYAIYSEYGQLIVALAVYLGALIAGAAIWSAARGANLERRFLDYRTLAEALRIQAMWTRSGLNSSVADYYLRKHRHELRWIRFALRGFSSNDAVIALLTQRRMAPVRMRFAIDEGIIRAWMVDQRAYYSNSANVRERRLANLQRCAAALYGLGIAAAIAAIGREFWNELGMVQHAIVLLMGVLPALAGMIGAWIKQVALAEEAARARAMESLFAHALQEWDHPQNAAVRASIAEDLGKEALHENADWLALRRERPIEAPLGSG